MTRYRFHWRDGSTTEGEGRTPLDALHRMGVDEDRIPYVVRFDVVSLGEECNVC